LVKGLGISPIDFKELEYQKALDLDAELTRYMKRIQQG
jgi:hypothetical protein